MMRIALISEHASPLAGLGGADSGGQNVYVNQVARHLAARGHQVDVFTRLDRSDLPPQVELARGVRLIHVPAGPAEFVRKEALLPYMAEFSDFMRWFCWREIPYDLIHANFFMSGLVGIDLKRSLHLPLVVTFHALGRVRRLHQGSADGFPEERLAIEDRIVREADQIVAECPQDETDLIDLYGASPRRLSIVPCGFDGEEFWPMGRAQARAQLGWNPSEPIILQLGRMVPRKGVETVIRAVARLRDTHNLCARLMIVGGESRDPDPRATPEIGRLQDICREEGVTDLVTFVGSRGRDELRTYYSAADVFVTTPWYEPFGITPLEAMACGLPVVGSAVGGIKMTVADGETGYLVPPRDELALAERLSRLLQQPDLLSRFSASAIRRVHNLFTWERVAQSLERVYAETLELSGHRRLPWPASRKAPARPSSAEVPVSTATY